MSDLPPGYPSAPPPQPPVPPPYPAQPGRRPASVTAAGALMIAMAALGLIGAIISLATIGQIVDEFRRRAARTDAAQSDVDTFVTVTQASIIGIAVITILIALLLAGLALGVLRGSNVARIITWVLCGIGILCGCCGIFSSFSRTTFSGGNQAQEELGRALTDSVPGWSSAIGGGLSGLQTLGYIAIAVLLALPAANAFFRKAAPAQPWQPPAM